MADDYFSRSQAAARAPERKSSRTRILLGAMLVAFLIGVALTAVVVGTGTLDWVWNGTAKVAEQPAGQKVPLAATSPLAAPLPSSVPAAQSGLDARIAGLEQRMAQFDLQSQSSVGNAARAEGLLIAFAARRAIERGQPLDYLQSQLMLRFGSLKGNPVNAVVAASKQPVTVEQLMGRLDDLAPAIVKDDEVSWASVKRELSELFIVRNESSPSPLPEDRVSRARLRLQAGNFDGAIGEVEKLPGGGRPETKAWITDARRYSNAMKALDAIEQAAILDPSMVRNAAAKQEPQAGPAIPTP